MRHKNESIIRGILLTVLTFIYSCSNKEDPIGKWDDIIELSEKYIEFEPIADSVIITIKGDWWWISEVFIGDSVYSYYNREDIDLESDNYTIAEYCFIVERRNKNTLFVKMDENSTKEERMLTIGLQAGNYFDALIITQAAK